MKFSNTHAHAAAILAALTVVPSATAAPVSSLHDLRRNVQDDFEGIKGALGPLLGETVDLSNIKTDGDAKEKIHKIVDVLIDMFGGMSNDKSTSATTTAEAAPVPGPTGTDAKSDVETEKGPEIDAQMAARALIDSTSLLSKRTPTDMHARVADLGESLAALPRDVDPTIWVSKRDLQSLEARFDIGPISVEATDFADIDAFKEWLGTLDPRQVLTWLLTGDLVADLTSAVLDEIADKTPLGEVIQKIGGCPQAEVVIPGTDVTVESSEVGEVDADNAQNDAEPPVVPDDDTVEVNVRDLGSLLKDVFTGGEIKPDDQQTAQDALNKINDVTDKVQDGAEKVADATKATFEEAKGKLMTKTLEIIDKADDVADDVKAMVKDQMDDALEKMKEFPKMLKEKTVDPAVKATLAKAFDKFLRMAVGKSKTRGLMKLFPQGWMMSVVIGIWQSELGIAIKDRLQCTIDLANNEYLTYIGDVVLQSRDLDMVTGTDVEMRDFGYTSPLNQLD